MKKYIGFLILAVSILVQSCKKDDVTVFTESPNERATAALTGYQKILTDATTGWKGILFPTGDTTKAYMFYFKFDNNNRVVMLSTFTDSFSRVPRESSYRLKALQTPTLIFDTYSYLSVLSDPNVTSSGNGGTVGVGLSSDIEFAFDYATTTADSITLTGRVNKSILKLTKLTTAQAAAVSSTGLVFTSLFPNIDKYLNYFKRVTINGVVYEIFANTTARTITFTWVDASGAVQSVKVAYYYSFNGAIEFTSPAVLSGLTITSFTDITWDAANLVMTLKINGTISTTVIGVGQPIKVDLSAAQAWWAWTKASTYVSSDLGFHINGVDDALGIKALAGFRRFDYYPTFTTNPVAVPAYDYTRIVGTTTYGVGVYPTFTADGKVSFKVPVYIGTVPTASLTTINNIATQMQQTSGYYLILITGGTAATTTYDMVSALDGKAWLRWHY